MKKKLKKLEKRVDAIAMEVVTLKNKGNDPLVNIDFNELSLEEAHRELCHKYSKHFGIPPHKLRCVTFNKEPKICEENIIKGVVVDSKVWRDCELRYPKGWYRSTKEGNLALLYFDGKDFLYGFNYKGEWEDEAHVCQDRKYLVFEEGVVILERESVIEQRLIEEAIKRGFNIDCEINCKNGQNFPAIVNEFEYVQEENKLLYSGIEIMKNGIWENCKPYDKPTFKPVFMKCTQEQFDRMRPKLESVGCEFTDSLIAKPSYVLTNDNQDRLISFVSESSGLNKQRNEVHTEAEFLEACGYVEENIEYKLETIRIDMRELEEYKITNIGSVLNLHGYRVNESLQSIKEKIRKGFHILEYLWTDDCFLMRNDLERENKHTITYEKFMELFSEKPIEEEQKTVRISDLPIRNIEELHAEHKEAKREPKVGDVVKAWDDNKDKFVYGVLNSIHRLSFFSHTVGDTNYKNIELVTEININDFKREEN